MFSLEKEKLRRFIKSILKYSKAWPALAKNEIFCELQRAVAGSFREADSNLLKGYFNN